MKKICIFVALLASTLVAIPGCSLFSDTPAESEIESSSGAGDKQSAYGELYKQVAAELKELDAIGGAWSNTEDMIGKAEEAAKGKDFDKAMKILKAASSETKLARAQFDQQKNAGPHMF